LPTITIAGSRRHQIVWELLSAGAYETSATSKFAEWKNPAKTPKTLTLYSTVQRVVQDLGVDQGRRVMTGTTGWYIADLLVSCG